MFIEQPPQFIRLLYPKALWRMDKNERAVYGAWIKTKELSTSLLMTAPYLKLLHGYLIYWTNIELKLPSSWWAIM